MSRENTLGEIINQFNKCAFDFKEKSGGLFCEVSSVYKGEKTTENIRSHYAKIFYTSYVLEFKFITHVILTTANNILECIVYFDKTEYATAYPLSFVLDFSNINTLAPLIIPHISNGQAMKESFELLVETLISHQHKISELSYNFEQKDIMKKQFRKEVLKVYKKEDASEEELDFYKWHYYEWLTMRSVCPAYTDFLTGRYSLASKKFNKLKLRSGYENRILSLMANTEDQKTNIPQMIYDNLAKYNSYGVPKTNYKEFSVMFFSWIVWTFILAPLFLLLYFLFYFFENSGAIYLMGPLSNLPNVGITSFILGIAASYFTRHKVFKLFYKKDYEKYAEMDYLNNSKSTDNFMKGFFAVILTVSIIFTMLMVRWNIKFIDVGFIDNTSFFSLRGEFYNYSEVEKVYYKASRVNSFGKTLEFPSYILALKNGKEIDFYEHEDISRYEDKLIKILSDKGIKIEK